METLVKKSKFCYRLVWVIAAICSHTLSFASFVPIPFTVSSDTQNKEIYLWD